MSVAITDAYRNVEVTGTGYLQENGTTVAKEVGATLTINAGIGISLVTDPETNKITIVNTGAGTGAYTTITDVNSDASYYPIFTRPPQSSDIDPSTGTYQMDTMYIDKTQQPMTYNPYTGTLICQYVQANVIGNIIGQAQGNADSATKLQTPRTINGVAFDGTANITFGTDSVAEGSTNLYFTTARARSSISAGGNLSYNSSTGVISYTTPSTTGIAEGTNLYYTDARARNSLAAGANIVYTASSGTIALANSLTITGGINAGTNTYTKIAAATASGNISFDNGTTNTPGVHFYYDNNTNIGIDSSVYGGKQAVRFTKNLDETGGTVVGAIDVDGLLTVSGISVTDVSVTNITNTSLQTNGAKFGYGTFTKDAAATTTGNVVFDANSTNTPGVHFYYANNSNFGIDSSIISSKQSLRFLKNMDEAGGTNLAWLDTDGMFSALSMNTNLITATGANFGGTTWSKISTSTTGGNVSFDNGNTNTPGVHFYYANNTNFGIDSAVVGSKQSLRLLHNVDETGSTALAWLDTDGLFSVTGVSATNVSATNLSVTNITNTSLQTNGAKFGYGTFTKDASAITTGNVVFDANSTNTPGVHFYYANNSNFGIDSAVVGSKQSLRFLKNLDETGGTSLAWLDTDGLFSVTGVSATNVSATNLSVTNITNTSLQSNVGKFGYGTFAKDASAITSGNLVLDNNGTNTPGIHFYYANNSNFGIDSAVTNSQQSLRFLKNLDETGGTVVGYFGVDNHLYVTGNIYANYSDERLKTVVGKIDNAVDKVCAIDTFYYKANDLAVSLGAEADVVQIGVGAGSVNRVAPEAVGKSALGNEYLTVMYERLVPLLIESIKEHEATIKELKAQVEKLSGK